MAPKIFCKAHRLGMFGPDYAWLVSGMPEAAWWRVVTGVAPGCEPRHLAAAVQGLLLVSGHIRAAGGAPPAAGLAYDAVWALALALARAQRLWEASGGPQLHHFHAGRRDMALEFRRQLGRLRFAGVSGPVSFDGADRVGVTAVYQVQDGVARAVALFHPGGAGHLDWSCGGQCVPLRWAAGQVPAARRVFRLRVVTVQPAAFLSVASLAAVGIALAVAFLAFNLHFRRRKYIKLSSPRLNNAAVIGCILVYVAVILLGLDHATLPSDEHFPAVCTARVYLLSAGFSLAFGSMFTKTYRVHRIFTRSRSGIVKDKLLRDTQLISLICALLLIDGLIVTLWVMVDPIQRHLRNLTLEISPSDRSVVYQPQVEVCQSQYTPRWLGALYVYKGLLLVVGVYMAWETRHVKIPALNDSQHIGVSVYSVVITSCIVVVLANLISERATLAFVTITALILASTTATLCLLFLPKMHAILGRAAAAQPDPIVQSMGLKIEYNTRRFVTDDRRELQYRVEVQNRVYRREVVALDSELARLRRQLAESPPSAGSVSSVARKALGGGSDVASTPAEEAAVAAAAAAAAKAAAALGKRGAAEDTTAALGGGLPMLLLSVLPPVIPRASWPSADHGHLPMRRQVTFSSEPELDDAAPRRSRAGDYAAAAAAVVAEAEASGSGKRGVLRRLRLLLGSRSPARKASTGSLGGGIASALRAHMGYLAGLVPGGDGAAARARASSVSCDELSGSATGRATRRHHLLLGSGPAISVTAIGGADDEDPVGDSAEWEDDCGGMGGSSGRSRHFSHFSLATLCVQRESERRAGAPQLAHRHSQPALAPRPRGSPRFPHRIAPAGSLGALEDARPRRASGGPPSAVAALGTTTSTTAAAGALLGRRAMGSSGRCRSLEESAGGGWGRRPRAASCSPSCDVWATAEVGIPLSELAAHGRSRAALGPPGASAPHLAR